MNRRLKLIEMTSTFLSLSLLLSISNVARAEVPDYLKTYKDDVKLLQLSQIPLLDEVENPQSDEVAITEEMIRLFNMNAEANRNADGTLNRGTHAKGVCFQAKVRLFSNDELTSQFRYPERLANRLKQGTFAGVGERAAYVRFANADGFGRVQSDTVDDVRGFSFSMQTDKRDYAGTQLQDFMMNSAPGFITPGIKEFSELVKLGALQMKHPKDFKLQINDLPNVFYFGDLFRNLSDPRLGNLTGHNTKSFATQEYWADLPYSHGLNDQGRVRDFVKYKVTPCDGRGTQKLLNTNGLASNYLQKDIAARAKSGQVCFYIQAQFFDLDDQRNSLRLSDPRKTWNLSDWIENGGALWDEDVMPFYTVAKIEIPRESSDQISCGDRYISTRLHSNVENMPVGSIARVRPIVEEISRFRRMGH